MKVFTIILGGAVGLLLGWVATGLLKRAKVEESADGVLTHHDRRAVPDSLRQWIRERDDLPEVRSHEEFLKVREANRESNRSPYRATVHELSWLQRMPLEEVLEIMERGGMRSGDQIRHAFVRWVVADPEAALENVDRVMNRDWKRIARQVVYAHWVRIDPMGLLDKLAVGEPTMERERKARAFLAAWASENPEQALASAGRLSRLFARPSEQLPEVRSQLLAAWLEKDEDAPFEWIEANAEREERDGLLDALVTARLKQGSVAEAVEYILDRPDQERLQRKLGALWRDWSMSNPAEALARMGTLPEDHPFWDAYATTVVQSALVTALATERAEEAVAALDRIPEGERRRRALLGMVQGASSNDVALAQDLMERLPESREREQAASFMVELWARDDLTAAGEWLSAQEPSASRDLATSRYVATLAGEDPALAAEWADAIERDELRQQTRESLYVRWREKDTEAAEAWRGTWK